jgi:hypothetical protein
MSCKSVVVTILTVHDLDLIGLNTESDEVEITTGDSPAKVISVSPVDPLVVINTSMTSLVTVLK